MIRYDNCFFIFYDSRNPKKYPAKLDFHIHDNSLKLESIITILIKINIIIIILKIIILFHILILFFP